LELGLLTVVGDSTNNGKLALNGAIELEEEMQSHIFGFGLCFKLRVLI
jgi:hypothetical protein